MKTGSHPDKGRKCIGQNVHVSADLAVRGRGQKKRMLF